MKETIKLGSILFLITSICAGLLGFVNTLTKPIIEEVKQKDTYAAIKEILVGAENVKVIEAATGNGIEAVYVAYTDATYKGAVIKVAPNGYGGAIEMLVGVDLEGRVAGVEILAHGETPGFGAKITEDHFKMQLVGKTSGVKAVKTTPSENDIEVISGATITSDAVTLGVNLAIDYVVANQMTLEEEVLK